MPQSGRFLEGEDAVDRACAIDGSGAGPQVAETASDGEPWSRCDVHRGTDVGVAQAIEARARAIGGWAETEERLLRVVGAPAVRVHDDSSVRETRQRQPRVDHPVSLERSEGDRAEVRVTAEESRTPIRRSDGKSPTGRDGANLRVEAFWGIQEALEEAAALKCQQRPLEAALPWRLERAGFLLTLSSELFRSGFGRRLLAGRVSRGGNRDQQRDDKTGRTCRGYWYHCLTIVRQLARRGFTNCRTRREARACGGEPGRARRGETAMPRRGRGRRCHR